jgi:hypothetical protein
MDLEQLKLILETLRAAGDTSATLFIVWMVLDKVFPPTVWLVSLSLVLWVVARFFPRPSSWKCGEVIRDLVGVGMPGQLTEPEAEATIARVRELVAAEKARG